MLVPLPDTLPQIVLFMATAAFAVFVSTFCAIFFWVTYRREIKLHTAWRPAGFVVLAITFCLHLLAVPAPELIGPALVVAVVAWYLIYRGVKAEPRLTALRTIASYDKNIPATTRPALAPNHFDHWKVVLVVGVGFGAWGLGLLLGMGAVLYLLAAAGITATIRLQWRRYRDEPAGWLTTWQNLTPLVGYVFLLLHSLAMAVACVLLPPAWLWYTALGALALGFFWLSLWLWIFIRVRPLLRASWLLLTNGALALCGVTFVLTFMVVLGIKIFLAQA